MELSEKQLAQANAYLKTLGLPGTATNADVREIKERPSGKLLVHFKSAHAALIDAEVVVEAEAVAETEQPTEQQQTRGRRGR